MTRGAYLHCVLGILHLRNQDEKPSDASEELILNRSSSDRVETHMKCPDSID